MPYLSLVFLDTYTHTQPSLVCLRINCAISLNALANDTYNYYVNHATERLFFFAVESEIHFFDTANDERPYASSSFIFPGLISRVTGLYPSNAISSYCFASPAKLRRLTRPPFDHLCICLSTDR